jgi:hypothetical protein
LTSVRIAARRTASLALVAVLATAILVGLAQPASAHEQRKVGQLNFVVGFGEEPAYAGLPNSVELTLSDAKDKPITDLAEGALSVDVMFGDQTTKLGMEPSFVVGVFGEPGEYGANFVPSRPGQYKFHFTGTVAGQQIDETFTSGPETFNDVEDAGEQMFPVQDPSTGQLAERLEREVARLESANNSSSDGTARALAIAGIVVAIAAVAVSLATLRRRA